MTQTQTLQAQAGTTIHEPETSRAPENPPAESVQALEGGGPESGHDSAEASRAPRPPKPQAATENRVRAAAAAALDRKALDLRVLELTEVSDFTDYFVICNGANARQVSSIAEAVERRLRADGARPLHLEGRGRGQWVLLDYGDVVVHVFDAERRELYRLERLWSDAPDRTADLAPA